MSSTVEGVTNDEISAIAQQVIDMQNEEDLDQAGPVDFRHRTGTSSAAPITVEDDPSTPTRSGSGRPIRQSASRSKNLDDIEESAKKARTEISIKKTKPEQSTSQIPSRKKPGPQSKSKSKTETKKKKIQIRGKRKRAFNGKVSMTARPLGRSDGQKRGEGIWPDKGENTVKGNLASCLSFTSSEH